jgi:2-polyprenyl-6-methoxyphenol hydroxylase-like FAD-dependent oxidoreductase
LSQGLNIKYNKRLKYILFELDGESVTAVFEDSAHVTGRLLVGTDGSRSSVREILLGAEKALVTAIFLDFRASKHYSSVLSPVVHRS